MKLRLVHVSINGVREGKRKLTSATPNKSLAFGIRSLLLIKKQNSSIVKEINKSTFVRYNENGF